jgi:hypothetical protein
MTAASVTLPSMSSEAEMRCTYCREWKAAAAFTPQGDHVVPASLGGTWIDYRVCAACNERANEVADELVGKDFLVRFLRALYEIPDRYGNSPAPPVFPVKLSSGVIKVTLHEDGPKFAARVPPAVAAELALDDLGDQDRLRRIVADELRETGEQVNGESLQIARIAQKQTTPLMAWSRFMAKLGLACGREAYGDAWLDSRQARILSRDLLNDAPPRFAQRWHHPPVEPAWPYEPPKHRLWIEPHSDTALLHIALFGQVLGAIPVNDLPADAYPSAWSLDPRGREGKSRVRRSTYPAIWLANTAHRALDVGGTPYVFAHSDYPFVYIPDGPDGPVDLGVPTERVSSPAEAFEVARRAALANRAPWGRSGYDRLRCDLVTASQQPRRDLDSSL